MDHGPAGMSRHKTIRLEERVLTVPFGPATLDTSATITASITPNRTMYEDWFAMPTLFSNSAYPLSINRFLTERTTPAIHHVYYTKLTIVNDVSTNGVCEPGPEGLNT